MLVSTRGKYGLSIMIDLATHSSEDAPAKMSDVCKRLGLYTKYAEDIVGQLTKKRLLKGQRGVKGGHYLARSVETYSVEDIVVACEDTPIRVVSAANRSKKVTRSEAVFWADLDAAVHTFMANVTLDTLIPKTTKKGKQNVRRKVAGKRGE